MKYISTRGNINPMSFKEAVITGMAPDGGLLIPESFPHIDVEGLQNMTYSQMAFEIIKHFADDICADDLKKIIEKSYATFDCAEVVPIKDIGECCLAELFHGPTYAFKDIALQFLGNIFEYILSENKNKLNIIGATSGDTGVAAIYGVRAKPGINIAILYPNGRVSTVQEKQMTSVKDKNVLTLAVDGNFDDCQNMVKEFFSDPEFKSKYRLGAVNSINWARITAQIVYYFYSYIKAGIKGKANFVVPTGNFGNIFAGYCAMRMGLPVEKLVIATNENDILHRFVESGDYSPATAKATHSPSMDIQVASNFERYLYFLFSGDTEKIKDAMNGLKQNGKIDFTIEEMKEVRKIFSSYCTSNKETEEAIKRIYDKCNYIIDPHTACAVEAVKALKLPEKSTIALATAHPAKFGNIVEKTLGIKLSHAIPLPEGLNFIENTAITRHEIENNYQTIKSRLISFFTGNN